MKTAARSFTEIEMFLAAGRHTDDMPIRDRVGPREDPFDIAWDNGALYYQLYDVDIRGNDIGISPRHFIVEAKHHIFTAPQAALVLDANLHFRKNKHSDYDKAEMKLQIKRIKMMPADTRFIYAGFNHFIKMQPGDIVYNDIGKQIWPIKPRAPRRAPEQKRL